MPKIRQNGGFQALTLLVYSTVPIILLLGGYYFFYVKSRTTEISKRNLRVLATASKQIETRLSGLTLVLNNAGCQCADADLKRWSEFPECVTDKDPDKRIQCCLRHSSLRELPALHLLEPPTASHGGAKPSLDRITSRPKVRVSIGYARTAWTTDNDTPALAYVQYPDPDVEPPLCPPVKDEESRPPAVIYASLNLHDLLDPILGFAVDYFFDDIVLADGEQIRYRQQADTGGAADLTALLSPAPTPSAPAATPAAQDTLSTGRPGAPKKQAVAHAHAQGFEDFEVYAQPVNLPAVAAGAPPWTLYGLVRTQRFTAETMEISPILLSALVLLLLAAVIAWPLLQLWHLGPRERLRASNVRLLAIFSVLAAGLATVAIADAYATAGLTAKVDSDLKSFGHALECSFKTELVAAAQQLHTGKEQLQEINERKEKLGDTSLPCYDRPDCTLKDITYPYFTQFFWLDGSGKPKGTWRVALDSDSAAPGGRWIADLVADPPLNVHDRDYFTAAQASALGQTAQMWRVIPPPGASCSGPPVPAAKQTAATPIEVAVSTVQSRTSGEVTVVLASAMDAEQGRGAADVAVLATPLLSLIQPAVPAALRYAVIDDTGKVLLHSDANRNLQENLFRECDQGQDLAAAVLARQTRYFDVMYYGWPDRLYIQPIEGTPWSLAVFGDNALLYALHHVTIMTWGSMFAVYLALIVAIAGLIRLCRPKFRFVGLWPDRHRSYARPIQGLLLLLALGAAVAWRDDTWCNLLVVMTALPLAVTWLHFTRRYRTPQVARTADAQRRSQSQYAVTLSLLLLVGGVLPAAILFKDAYEQGTVQLAKYAEWRFAGALLGRVDRIQKSLRAGYSHQPEQLTTALRTWLNAPWGSYEPPSWPPPAPGSLNRLRPHFSAAFLQRIPAYTQIGRQFTALADAAASDGAWQWNLDANDQMTFTVCDARLNSQLQQVPRYLAAHTTPVVCGSPAMPNRPLSRAVPPESFPTWTQCDTQVAVLWFALLALYPGFLGIRAVARRLFLLDTDPTVIGEGTWHFCKASGVTPSNQHKGVIPIDLAQISTPAACAERLKTARVGDTIALQHFEAHLGEPDWDAVKLTLLEQLVHDGTHGVTLSTTINPLDYFSAAYIDAQAEGIANDTLTTTFQRWRHVFAAFPPPEFIPSTTAPPLPSTTGAEPLAHMRYWTLWSQCTKAEQLTLVQLAQEGFLNPNNQDVARRLLQRQLIRRTPVFALMEDDFRRFVMQAVGAERVAQWEKEGTLSNWSKLRTPLLVLLMFTVAFFLSTQADLVNSTVGLLSATGAAVPVLLKLLDLFRSGRSEGPAQPAPSSGGK